MVACPPIRKSPFPARPRSPSIRAWRKARLKLWPSPKENTVQRSRSPISGITPETSALAWTPPSKIKLATIGKNDFVEIDSMLNPDVGERLQQAPRRRGNETSARGKPREFSVICYPLKGHHGAVRTSLTHLVQNIGNTFLVFILSLFSCL